MGKNKQKKEKRSYVSLPSRSLVGPGLDAERYVGPIVSPRALSGNDTIIRTLTTAGNFTSDAGGEIKFVAQSDPTGLSDWSNLSAAYDRYRVLGIEVMYEPHSMYNPFGLATGTSIIRQPISVVSDLDDTSALTSHSGAAQYATHRFHNLARPFRHEVRANGKLLMQYNTTASSPPVQMAIKAYAGTGLSGTTTYGIYIVRMLVQFANAN